MERWECLLLNWCVRINWNSDFCFLSFFNYNFCGEETEDSTPVQVASLFEVPV